MRALQRWVHRPQSLWVRKVLFQVHLWVGIGIGLYVLAISISGSAIVYRRELASKYAHKTVILAPSSGRRLTLEELKQIAQRVYPAYEVLGLSEPEENDRPDHVVLERRGRRIERLFDPHTGADLGNPQSGVYRAVTWLADLHDNLLSGLNGRIVNGMGAFLLILLALTGAVIWWPGIKNWRRSIAIDRRARFARFTWDLHSAIGFWCSLFVLVWGFSGFCLCFPGVLDFLVTGQFLLWLTRLHFGQFNWFTKALWTIAGLVPAVLAGTGALMWWNRLLRKKIQKLRGADWIYQQLQPPRT